MRQNGVPFREWDMEKTEYGETRFRQLGGTGIPLLTLGPDTMTGFDAERFMALSKNSQNRH
jgi:hypothetical protein